MYMRELLFSLGRRWYLAVFALLLTVGACVGVSRVVAAEYEAKASVVLLPPESVEDPGANRFLMLQQLGQATGVVIRAMNGDDTHAAVAPSLVGGATYTVEPDYTTNAPILVITVTSPTAGGATNLLQAVEQQVPTILTRLQADVSIPASARITAVQLTTPREPVVNSKKQLRAVVATGVGLAAILALLIGAIDGYLTRRSLRQPLEDETRNGVLSEVSSSPRPVDAVEIARVVKRRERRGRRQQSGDDDGSDSLDRVNLG